MCINGIYMKIFFFFCCFFFKQINVLPRFSFTNKLKRKHRIEDKHAWRDIISSRKCFLSFLKKSNPYGNLFFQIKN